MDDKIVSELTFKRLIGALVGSSIGIYTFASLTLPLLAIVGSENSF